MAKRLLRLTLPAFAALGVACGGLFEPEPPVLSRLELTPTNDTLYTAEPGNSLGLYLGAYDQAGAPMQGTGAATYASSAPATAAVSSSGVVTAVTPGTAAITAVLTLGGVTRTASMTVTVYARDYSDIAGVYDLTAPVTIFEPGGMTLEGSRYTAVLRLWDEWGFPPIGGTHAEIVIMQNGSSAISDSGFVSASMNDRGRLLVKLLGGDQDAGLGLTLRVATLTPGFIDGTFLGPDRLGRHGGRFTAIRRPPQ